MSSSANLLDLSVTNTRSQLGHPLAAAGRGDEPITVIRPVSRWNLINLGELWQYRELLATLIWREVKVRYKQTLLGAAWAILQPLLMTIVFTIFFGRMAGVQSGGLPYPLFAFAGLMPWTFFSTAVANAGNSVIGNERLISKIYFPRLAIPFSSVGAALVDFFAAFTMMIILMVWYRVAPTMQLLWLPVIVALISFAALGMGTLLAALNVAYRDFRYVIPFLLQLWMFATPTVYMQPENFAGDQTTSVTRHHVSTPSTAPAVTQTARNNEGVVPNYLQTILNLNPLVGLIAGFRSTLLGTPLPWVSLGWSVVGAALMLVLGCLYFRHVEDSFADII